MSPEAFAPGAPGKILVVGSGAASYRAFVPHPLPPTIRWSDDLVRLLSAADRALGQLAGIGRNLPNPHLLISPFARREAVLSSRIEGTRASLHDLLLFEADPAAASLPDDVHEVENYIRALNHGITSQRRLPMSLRLIREMHSILMTGVRGQERTPGQFRRSQNWIGPPGSVINTATFIPPPPHELDACLTQFEAYLHAPSAMPPLVRLATIHYQFEAIHPFLDGNGRIGRLLITLILCIERVLPGPLLYLSAFFEKRRAEYYRHLLEVSTRGAWDQWVCFFLAGVAEQASDALTRAQRLIDLRGSTLRRIEHRRTSVLLSRLVNHLFDRPSITVAAAAAHLGVTRPIAQKHIDALARIGFVREATGRKRGRIWVAEPVRKIIE